MRVLLLKEVKGLGQPGDIKEVANGYAANYLLPNKMAQAVSEGNVKLAQQAREAEARKAERKSNEAKNLAAKLEGQTIVLKGRSGEGDRLYGSITGQDVAEALSKSTGLAVDKRIVDIEHPIKTLGTHTVTLKLGGGLTAAITVIVEKAKEPE